MVCGCAVCVVSKADSFFLIFLAAAYIIFVSCWGGGGSGSLAGSSFCRHRATTTLSQAHSFSFGQFGPFQSSSLGLSESVSQTVSRGFNQPNPNNTNCFLFAGQKGD